MKPISIRKIFHLILGLTYIGLGVFMYVKHVVPYPPWDAILSIAFGVYGLFRIYRGLRMNEAEEI